MKKIFIAFVLALTFSTPAFAKLNVVATLPWIGSLADDLGRDRVTVKTLVQPNRDPHHIEAKPSMILSARSADLLIYNGLDLEIGYLPLLIESSRNAKIQPGQPGNLDCSQFISVIEKSVTADRSMGDVHPLGHPHYHLSSQNILRVARGIAQTLAGLDPDQATFYRSNLAAFETKLKDKQKQWSSTPLKGKRFVAYHKFFEYLALENGFQLIGDIEEKPGIPPSAGYVERLVESMKKSKPDAIISTGYNDQKVVSAVSRMTGVRSIIVPDDVGSVPGITDWFSLMDAILTSLK
jgi:zinc/manganese transport system substrate-binding protein